MKAAYAVATDRQHVFFHLLPDLGPVPVADTANPHLVEHLGDVDRLARRLRKIPQDEIVIGRNTEIDVVVAEPLVDLAPQVKRGVGRHPAILQPPGVEGPSRPVPDDTFRVSLCDIVQITEHRLNRRIFERRRNPSQNPIVREKVVAMDEADDIAGSVSYALVQSVINTFVGLANQPHPVVASAVDDRQGSILRFSLDDQMLDVRMRLRGDTGDGLADGRFRIINSGNYRDFQRRGLSNSGFTTSLHETGLGRNAKLSLGVSHLNLKTIFAMQRICLSFNGRSAFRLERS